MAKKTQSSKKRIRKNTKGIRHTLNKQSNLILLIAVLLFLTGAMVVSDGGITGFASRVNGSTNITVSTAVSLQLVDGVIDFGTCTPGYLGINVSSENLSSPIECTGGTYPDFMTVRNIGNVDIDLTIDAYAVSGTLFGGTNPEFTYGALNESGTIGCNGTYVTGYNAFDSVTNPQNLCDSLEYTNSRAVNITIQVYVPADATADVYNTSIEFIGTSIT
jgi:hypothetical protein